MRPRGAVLEHAALDVMWKIGEVWTITHRRQIGRLRFLPLRTLASQCFQITSSPDQIRSSILADLCFDVALLLIFHEFSQSRGLVSGRSARRHCMSTLALVCCRAWGKYSKYLTMSSLFSQHHFLSCQDVDLFILCRCEDVSVSTGFPSLVFPHAVRDSIIVLRSHPSAPGFQKACP